MSTSELEVSSDCLDVSVPVLPPAVGYLLSTLYDEYLNINFVAAVVERFPSIAARVLTVANSVWASPPTPITDLPAACVWLGLDQVRTLSIALAVANTFAPSRCPGFDGERYWTTALLAAEGATLLAGRMNQNDAALTWRSTALFHNIGLLWLADRYPQATDAALARDVDEDLALTMQRTLGTDFRQAGARLADVWELPGVYPHVIRYHGQPDAAGPHFLAAASVGLAADMASMLYRGEAWTPDRMPANMGSYLGADTAESAYRSLAVTLDNIQAIGRMIVNA